MKLNLEGLEMRKENMPTDKTRKVDEKMGHLLSCYTPRVMVIKMSKMFHFLYFLLMRAKN